MDQFVFIKNTKFPVPTVMNFIKTIKKASQTNCREAQ
jgi:hypothetical protein